MGSTSVSLLAICPVFLFFNATAPTEFNTCGPPLSRHDAIPFSLAEWDPPGAGAVTGPGQADTAGPGGATGEASPDPLDVPARVVPDGPAVPDSTATTVEDEPFPLALLMAGVGAALLAALVAGVRPWRWLPNRAKDPEDRKRTRLNSST